MDKIPLNILVTGTSRGIGRAIFDRLNKCHPDGYDIRVIGHATVQQDGMIAADFSDPDGASILWKTAMEYFDGHIDILINNAGVFERNPIDETDTAWRASWNRTMQVNLTASAELCRLAIIHWQKNKQSGRIINIASRAAYRGDSPDHWHYAASKAGMVAMTKSIARAYAKDDIYAFAICPGFTMTGMAEDYLESRGGDKLLADIPLGRVAEPGEIAKMAIFCAFDAPPSMTGAVLDANGASYVR